jgi:hypothetical protein
MRQQRWRATGMWHVGAQSALAKRDRASHPCSGRWWRCQTKTARAGWWALPALRNAQSLPIFQQLAGKARCSRHLSPSARTKALASFCKGAMKRYGPPRLIVTDRLGSYQSAMKMIVYAERQQCGRRLNNRAENSHQPFRRCEGGLTRFRYIKTLQKFANGVNWLPEGFGQLSACVQSERV